MNNLSLANSLIQKAGISGGALATVANQTGEPGRVVSWINEAYLNIQLADPTWYWLRTTVQFNTTAGKYNYTPTECGVSDFGLWKMDSFRRYLTSTGVRGEFFLSDIPYDEWRDTFLFGNMRLTQGDIRFIAQGPDKSLNLGLVPGDVYTIVGEYFKAPTTLTLDADVPLIPTQYQMIIVYRAMMMYGMYEAASEVVQEGTSLYNTMLRRLMRDQSPQIFTGGALA